MYLRKLIKNVKTSHFFETIFLNIELNRSLLPTRQMLPSIFLLTPLLSYESRLSPFMPALAGSDPLTRVSLLLVSNGYLSFYGLTGFVDISQKKSDS